jgi:hypothetical protein
MSDIHDADAASGRPVKSNQVVVVVDNDECIGSLAACSLLANFFRLQNQPERIGQVFHVFADYCLCLRPGLREFFNQLLKWKKVNHKLACEWKETNALSVPQPHFLFPCFFSYLKKNRRDVCTP